MRLRGWRKQLAQEGALSAAERERLVNDVQHELFGLGPLTLLADLPISDILVNAYHTIYIERRGKLESTNVAFKDDEHLMRVIERIVSSVGRRIDESSPMVDARLRMVHVSTQSFPRFQSTVPSCRFAALVQTHCECRH